jgi:adenylate cyclase
MAFLSKLLRSLLIGTIVGLAIALFTNFFFKPLIDRLEWQTYDMRYVWEFQDFVHAKGGQKEDPAYGIHIINIDDRSLQKMGVYWHWDRSFHAKMLRSLGRHFPAACVFDILFYEPEDTIYQRRQDNLLLRSTEINPAINLPVSLRSEIVSTLDYDQQFIDAARRLGTVFFGMRLSNKSDYPEFALSAIQSKMTLEWHGSLKPPSALYLPPAIRKSVFNPGNEKPIIDGIFPELAHVARDIGYVNVVPDKDGTIRRLPLMFAFGKFPPVYLPISVRTCISLFGTPAEELVFVPEKYLDIGKPFKIARDSAGVLRCSYPHVSMSQIEAILDRSKEILALGPGSSLDLTAMLSIGKDDQAKPFFSMYWTNGNMPKEVFDAFSGASFDSLLALPVSGERDLGNEVKLRRDSDVDWILNAPFGDQEWYLSKLDLQTMKRVTPADFEMVAPGESKLLFSTFSVSNQKGILTSTIPVLRDQALRELCMTPWNTIVDLQPKMRMDFGKSVRMPVDKDNQLLVTYFGPKSKPFPYYSYYDIMNDRAQGNLEEKIFIVGSTAADMFDIKPVPHDETFPAVEIHASLINSIMTDTFITRLADWQNFLILLLVGIIIGIISFALKPLPGAIISVLSIFAYFLVAMQVFGTDHLWIEIARPVLTILLTFTAVMAYRYVTEEKDRKFLQSTFKQYLSPELIDIMYKNKQMPQLGGDEGIRTAYFTDIQGFSTFSEKLGSPTRLVELLNEYLSAMTDILLKHYGTLDKYEGDAIIAFFGAPMPMQNHAVAACKTALDMQKKLDDLRRKWVSEGEKWPNIVHEMRMRIGVNTGPIVTGNMGSKVRMNYTMMGDAVNLAARLESAAKQYGVYSMISQTTYDMVKDQFDARQLDKVTVVGKSEPVTIYELMALKGQLDPAVTEMARMYGEGLKYFYDQQWDKAIAILRDSERMEPFRLIAPKNMTPSAKIMQYCEMYKSNPPGKDWDGVIRLTSK